MQIVIDIDKNMYNAVKNPSIDSGYCANECYNAVQCGTPLPKGHGDLIDKNEYFQGNFNDAREFLDRATTIIEADKGVNI